MTSTKAIFHPRFGVTFIELEKEAKKIGEGWSEDFPDGYRPRFPKTKYHPELKPIVVATADQERNLGVGWFDAPQQLLPPETPNGAEFPKCKYYYEGAELKTFVAISRAQEEALGEGWYDTPTLAMRALEQEKAQLEAEKEQIQQEIQEEIETHQKRPYRRKER